MERLALKVKEAAEMLGVSKSWLYERIREKKIPCVVIDGKRLIPSEGLRKMFGAVEGQAK